MALVPFTYANPFTDQLRLPERLFTIDGRLIRIKQAWKDGGKGGTDIGFGASVYPAAFVLADFLERHPYLIRGKRVIELGTGTGFLGIAAASLGAAEVCLTDGDDASLRLAESNIAANIPWMQDLGRESAASGFVSTRRLRWGCAGDIEALLASSGNSLSSSSPCDGGDSPWEVIVGSDIAAFPYASAYDDLLQTIAALAKSIRKFQSATSGSDGKGLGEEHRHSCSNAANSQPSGSNNEKHRSHCSATCKEGKRSKRTAPAATSEHKLNANASSRRGQRLTEEGEATGAGKVVVLLAHKQRHDSEEAFFRAAKESLGASVDLGEEDVHPDFRDSGIRLHMFVVD